MELAFRDGKYAGTWRHTQKDYTMKLSPQHEYCRILVAIHYPQHEYNGHAKVFGRKLIVAVKTGIVIFPEDMSYKQFINNTYYEGVDFSTGNAIQSGIQ